MFGEPGVEWNTKLPVEPNHLYPKDEHIRDFPVYRRVKLSSIVYKLNSDKTPLMGIQLKFTNGVKSPLFQTSAALEINKVQEA